VFKFHELVNKEPVVQLPIVGKMTSTGSEDKAACYSAGSGNCYVGGWGLKRQRRGADRLQGSLKKMYQTPLYSDFDVFTTDR